MTWQGILTIFVFGIVFAFVAAWLEDHVFAEMGKCDKCGHDSRYCKREKCQ